MKYFSGFSLRGESQLFSRYIDDSDFLVVGFSYGAQLAFEHVYSKPQDRIDRLILISPAYFQEEKSSFTRTQLRYFEHNKEAYVDQFLKNVSYPNTIELDRYLHLGSSDELKSLLTYRWSADKIEELIDRGVEIEVFLGGKDRIIDSQKAFKFFSNLTTTYLIKESGHIAI